MGCNITLSFIYNSPVYTIKDEKFQTINNMFKDNQIPLIIRNSTIDTSLGQDKVLSIYESLQWDDDFNKLFWFIKRLSSQAPDLFISLAIESSKTNTIYLENLELFIKRIKRLKGVRFAKTLNNFNDTKWLKKIKAKKIVLDKIYKELTLITKKRIQDPNVYLNSPGFYTKKIVINKFLLFILKDLKFCKIFNFLELKGFLRFVLFSSHNLNLYFKIKFLRRRTINKSILCLTSSINMGGAEKVLIQTIQGLKKYNYNFSILAHKGQKKQWCVEALKLFYYKFFYTTYANDKDLTFQEKFYKYFLKPLIIKLNVRIIYITNIEGPYEYLPQIKEDFPNIKIIDVLHYKGCPGTNKYSTKFVRYIDKRICISRNIQKYLTTVYSLSKVENKYFDNTTTIYNGNNFKFFQKNPAQGISNRKHFHVEGDEIVISFIGRFSAEKSPMSFVNIANTFKKDHPEIKNIKWIMAGSGSEENIVKEKINKYNLQESFFLTGTLSENEIKKLLNISFILLIVSESEGIPLVLIEALSMSVPVISTNIGGINEAISEAVNGYLVNPLENIEKSFANHIFNLIQDKNLYKTIQANTKSSIAENFSLENMIKHYKQNFDQLIYNKQKLT